MAIARNPDVRLREIANEVGITERATHALVTDLVEAGYLSMRKEGRRNVYAVNAHLPLRHPLEQKYEIGALLASIGAGTPSGSPRSVPRA